MYSSAKQSSSKEVAKQHMQQQSITNGICAAVALM